MTTIPRIPFDREKLQYLREELGIRPYKPKIHDQPREWLREKFEAPHEDPEKEDQVNVARLIRNILFQTYTRVQTDKEENDSLDPLDEIIRSLWYMYVKQTLSRAGALSGDWDQYDEMVKQLVKLTRKEDLFDYRDIGFRDHNRENRILGEFSHIILFAEKEGQMAFLREMHDKYGISVIALGGQPSALTMEYFVDLIKNGTEEIEPTDLRRSFYLFSIVDFDPSGWEIEEAFIENLNFHGIHNIQLTRLVHPDMLKTEHEGNNEIKNSRFRVDDQSQGEKKVNTRWVRRIRDEGYENLEELGIDLESDPRKIFGLETAAVSTDRMNRWILAEQIPPLTGESEKELRIKEFHQLQKNLKELAFA